MSRKEKESNYALTFGFEPRFPKRAVGEMSGYKIQGLDSVLIFRAESSDRVGWRIPIGNIATYSEQIDFLRELGIELNIFPLDHFERLYEEGGDDTEEHSEYRRKEPIYRCVYKYLPHHPMPMLLTTMNLSEHYVKQKLPLIYKRMDIE